MVPFTWAHSGSDFPPWLAEVVPPYHGHNRCLPKLGAATPLARPISNRGALVLVHKVSPQVRPGWLDQESPGLAKFQGLPGVHPAHLQVMGEFRPEWLAEIFGADGPVQAIFKNVYA